MFSTLTRTMFKRETRRDSLSDFLPWLYESDPGQYLLADNTEGYLWELTPRRIYTDDTIRKLESILRTRLSRGTVMQFLLYADPYIKDFLDAFASRKKRKDPVVQKTVHEYIEYLQQCNRGLEKLYNTPLRNFRLFFCIKSPEEISADVIANLEEKLSGCHLQPRRMEGNTLLLLLRRIMNGLEKEQTDNVDKNRPLSQQIINADTVLEFEKTRTGTIRIGKDCVAHVLTPKTLPKTLDSTQANQMVGGFMGMEDDTNQIMSPFIYSLNIIYGSAQEEVSSKATFIMSQRATGRIAKKIGKMVADYDWATDRMEKEAFVAVIPSVVVFDRTEQRLSESSSRVERLWEDHDFIMQKETFLSRIMFICSLPFGFYNIDNNLENLQRDFPMPQSSAARLIPFQGDYRGSANPVLLFQGRKGQIIPLDIYDKRANNHNFLVSAESGSGKSFFLNYLTQGYYAENSIIRLLDIGYSYKKQSSILNGRFIDYGKENVVTNPFFCSGDAEDIERNLITCSRIMAQMAYSASGAAMRETEWTLMKKAVFHVHDKGDVENGVDAVRDYLFHFKDHMDEETGRFENAIKLAEELAFNLEAFATTGVYGRYFNGANTFDISNDQHVIIELERIKDNAELMSVCILQILNSITQDLYLSDRSMERFILFDEFKTAVRDNKRSDSSRIAAIFDEGYRRARKYGGSFGVVLQSITDLQGLGELGNVIWANAAFKFYLQGQGYESALKTCLEHIGGIDKETLPTVANNKPRYSEIFIESPFGNGIVRLSVNDWLYQLNNTEAHLTSHYDAHIRDGLTPLEAINAMAGAAQ